MNSQLLKAKFKKDKFFNSVKDCDSSDDSLSSDDESNLELEITGIILNNRYIAIKYLSRGTFSKIWLVYDIETDKCRIAKIFDKDSFSEYENEITIFKEIDNYDYLVELFDSFDLERDNKYYKVIIYELLGVSLLNIINDVYDNKFNLSSSIIINIYKQLMKSFEYIHSIKIIHCDIKPDNILFDILPNNISHLVTLIKNLDLPQKILKINKEIIPSDIQEYNKNKRKNIKKKLKIKSLKLLRDYLIDSIKSSKELNVMELNIMNDAEEFQTDIKYNYNKILQNDFKVKLIDFSNSELSNDISESELFIRSYRPIENIINYTYNCKADVWALGCIFYEILTGLELFSDEHSYPKHERTKIHLYKITKTFGPIQKQMIDNCDLYDDLFFKNKINLRDKSMLDYLNSSLPFEQELKNNIIFDFDTKTFSNFSNLIKLCFEYNPKLRIDCANLLLYIDNF
jgi:serine/threonine protein kinase